MTYFTSTGEFLFEFDLEDCGVNMDYGTSLSEYEQCFSDRGGDFGHYDLQWEGTATDCYPGSPSCTTAPTNSLDLSDSLGVTEATGAGNLLFSYYSIANDWAVVSLGANGIDDELNAAVPNVVTQAHADMSPPGTEQTRLVANFVGSDCPGTEYSSERGGRQSRRVLPTSGRFRGIGVFARPANALGWTHSQPPSSLPFAASSAAG